MSQNFINFQLYLSDFSVSLKNWPSRYILAFERLVHSLDSQINLFGSIEIMYEFCDSNFEYNDVLLWDMAFLAKVAAFLSYTIHSFSNCYSNVSCADVLQNETFSHFIFDAKTIHSLYDILVHLYFFHNENFYILTKEKS